MAIIKTLHGDIEEMPNGKIIGTAVVKSISPALELDILSNYIDLGFMIESNEYVLSGGGVNVIVFRYIDEDDEQIEDICETINHGIIIMNTLLTKYVPTQDK
tara:strand:- start:4957 stop:5262 length:306 start_codon:yes stop_codon:yes gene_type:complete